RSEPSAGVSAADISHPASWRLAQRLAAAAGVAVTIFIFLMLLSPEAVFSKELGVCEATAVRDVLAGHIVLPRFDPTVYVHTPPLYWWIAAITARSLGWNELALRLPSLIATALLAAVVFDWTAITIFL